MLTDKEFFIQSLVSNLYYLWTLREFSARIEVSFPPIYNNYVERCKNLAKRAEINSKKAAKYANNSLPESVIKSEIVVTPYTLELELLTEKLFGIDIDTNVTELEKSIKAGDMNPTKEQIKDMENINEESKKIANDFIAFANELHSKMENQEIFAYYYNTLNLYIIQEANLFKTSLERLTEKATINPSYVIDYQYYSTLKMQAIATFIRGEIDPMFKEIFDEANNFVIEYRNILDEYDNMNMTPDNQKNMTINSLEIAERFKLFIEKCIQKLLKKEIYFISPPITKDNALTNVNFFIFNLKEGVLESLKNI